MNRRWSDDVQRKIDEWEQLRNELGGDATHAVIGYISSELDRLRLEKLVRSRPLPGGRRAGDPQPRTIDEVRADRVRHGGSGCGAE